MKNYQLFSRRDTERKVDFRPDVDEASPFMQMRRLAAYMARVDPEAADITDCPDALNYLREYTYRKIFTGTSHWDYIQVEQDDPQAIDWLIAIHETETANFYQRKASTNKGAR